MFKNYVKKDGFYVDVETGECHEELVFEDRPQPAYANDTFHADGRKIRFKNPLRQKLNVYITRDQKKHYVYTFIQDFIDKLHFSFELKKQLKDQVINSNQKNSTDAIVYICKIIYERNLPITTKELFRVIDTVKNNNIIKKAIKTPFRDYSWYINRLLSKFNFIDKVTYQTLYKKILENYKKLSIKLSLYSPAFISTLTYLTIIAKFPNRTFKYITFETQNATVTYHRKRLREIGVQCPVQK